MSFVLSYSMNACMKTHHCSAASTSKSDFGGAGGSSISSLALQRGYNSDTMLHCGFAQ